jgi:hypothetical protein
MIPNKFSKKYIQDCEETTIIRAIGDDKTWKVKVKHVRSPRNFFAFKSGWIAFGKEYNSQIGDVCTFVMTRSKPLSFTVSITRKLERNQYFSFFVHYLFVSFRF